MTLDFLWSGFFFFSSLSYLPSVRVCKKFRVISDFIVFFCLCFFLHWRWFWLNVFKPHRFSRFEELLLCFDAFEAWRDFVFFVFGNIDLVACSYLALEHLLTVYKTKDVSSRCCVDHRAVHHILISWFLFSPLWNQMSRRRSGGWKLAIIKMEATRQNQALTPIDLANLIACIIWELALVAMEVIVASIILSTLLRYKLFCFCKNIGISRLTPMSHNHLWYTWFLMIFYLLMIE